MHVSSEVRRREIPEKSPDPSPYAAAAQGASFMAVLSEVGRSSPDNSASSAVAESEGTDRTTATESKVPEDPPSKDPAVKTGDADEGSPDIPDAENTSTSENLPVADGADQPVPTSPTATSGPVAASAAAATAASDPAVAVVASVVDSGTNLTVESLSQSTGTAPAAGTNAPPLSSALLASTAARGANSDAVTEGDNVEAAPATTSTVETTTTSAFPKTLNAIIAEGALRQHADEGNETDTALKDDSLETVTEATAPDTAQDLPKSTPLPQSPALEAGGVRPQTTSALPRLPMANLPGELAQQIHAMQQEGATSMRLRLVPENLGDIQIEIHGSGDRLHVRLVSANPAVRDALESQMGDLKNALQKQGLALDNATVGGEAAGRNASRQPERQASPPASYPAPSTLPEVTSARIKSVPTPVLGSSALNILA